MKYEHYSTEDFIQDHYFQKWVLDTDTMTDSFWSQWLEKHPEKKEIIAEAKRMVQLLAMEGSPERMTENDFDATWQQIIEQRTDSDGNRNKRIYLIQKSLKPLLRVAAIFVGLLALGGGIYYSGIFNSGAATPSLEGPQITLELEDGTIKVLDETTSEIIKTAEGSLVANQIKNSLQYEDVPMESENLVYNQLTVPYGKKFEVHLADGSHVYLNSGSKLRYPVRFLSDAPRDVYLDGEGYFEVQEDKMRPFTVITDDMNTQVYGTEFNVSSYKNEQNTSTVLIEGSVGVYKSNNEEGSQSITIVPGQRAVFEDDRIAVEEVAVNKYVAWKDGKLYFVDDRLDLILKELERHFDVKIENDFAALNSKRFTGTFTTESLDQILRVAKEYTAFEYEIKGDTIRITKTNKE